MTALALWFALPPLLRRPAAASRMPDATVAVYRAQLEELEADLRTGKLSAGAAAESRRELERRLLDDNTSVAGNSRLPLTVPKANKAEAVLAAVALPLLAALIYFQLGRPDALRSPSPAAVSADASPAAAGGETAANIAERLTAQLERTPDDARGWYALARAQISAGRFPLADRAYARAAALVPGNASLLVEHAEAVARGQGHDLEGKPMELIRAALKVDPAHQRALALAATAEFGKGQYSASIDYWHRLQATLDEDSEGARKVAHRIAQARAALTEPTGQAAAAPAAARPVSGTVRLSPALRAKIAPGATLFVFARSAEAPQVPLAVLRAPASDLPMAFNLDDSNAMDPTKKLSGAEGLLTIGARVAGSGNALAQSGDLHGVVSQVRPGQGGIDIVIDSVVP